MCDIENLELLKKYICDEIMNFEPIITKGDYLHQFDVFLYKLIDSNFQGIICLYQRVVDLKRKINEYEKALKELKDKIPDIQI